MILSSAGLCASCRHARSVVSGRGSRFVLCERSRTEPAYPRYPRLPVVACAGYGPPGDTEAPESPPRTGDLDARDGSNLDSADI